MSDEKVEKKEEVKKEDFSDIFVTEQDIFDISLKYYKKNGKIFVEGVDNEYNEEGNTVKTINMTFKFPSQSDCSQISLSIARVDGDLDKLDIRDFLKIETNRMIVLMRKWNINNELNVENVMKLSPNVIRGLLAKIREKIGTEGIF